MKHNVSITMDQKLFRELETIRGREKRSTFIEHLIITGLKKYQNETHQILPSHASNSIQQSKTFYTNSNAK